MQQDKIFNLIKKQRENIIAPVDLYGCKAIYDSNEDNKELKILVALILSSQTRDEVTYEALNKLDTNLKDGLSLKALNEEKEEEINKLIKKVGFHNKKAKFLKEIGNQCLKEGIPNNIDELIKLPGIGMKIGILYLQYTQNKLIGISVDTHVHRISNRLGIVKSKSPEATRIQLEAFFDRRYWEEINLLFVGFGQVVCKPRKPSCDKCCLKELCPSSSW